MPEHENRKIIRGQKREIVIETKIYDILGKSFNPAFWGYACPIGHQFCAELDDILDGYSNKNVFVAIPYSDYAYENAIKEVLKAASLTPKLAKQKIQTRVILCKICREMRKCKYGVADISRDNTNVAYELGLMQSLGRNCAILLSAEAKRQTDLEGIENVSYSTPDELKLQFGKWIEDNIPESDKESLNEYLQGL